DATWMAQDEDILSRKAACDTLIRTLRTLPAPGCVALYGAWGAGKTTLIRTAHDVWSGKESGKPLGPAVWFDPWEHEQRADVSSPFLPALVTALREDRALALDEERLKQMKRLAAGIARTLLSLTVRIGAAYAFGLASDPLKKLSDVKLDDFSK